MSKRADYTSEEWTMLLLAPVQAGAAVVVSSKSGLVGTAQEILALHNATNKSVAQKYPHNTLIQDLLTGEHKNEYAAVSQKITSYVKDQTARDQLQSEVIQTCHNVASILAQKASPQEAEEYKRWVMGVCTQVAQAALEEGQKVSPAEEDTMREIAMALQVTPSRTS